MWLYFMFRPSLDTGNLPNSQVIVLSAFGAVVFSAMVWWNIRHPLSSGAGFLELLLTFFRIYFPYALLFPFYALRGGLWREGPIDWWHVLSAAIFAFTTMGAVALITAFFMHRYGNGVQN